jgi:Zn-dependent oligopeptidase
LQLPDAISLLLRGNYLWQIKQLKKGGQSVTSLKKPGPKLSKKERRETDEKKKTASKTGKQFVPNTERAKKARKAVSKAEQRKLNS